MGGIVGKITVAVEFFSRLKRLVFWTIKSFPDKESFGLFGKFSVLGNPYNIGNPCAVFIHEQVEVRYGFTVINTKTEKVIIKKYSVIAPLCTIITNSHRPTVGIPQFILGVSHVNDKSADVIINEDVWVGAQCTILAGVNIGRGAVVGARALITKNVPPYALVVGMPAKIVGVKFSKAGIIKHEQMLYPENERMTEQEIDSLFEKYYSDKKILGCEAPLTEEQKDTVEKVSRSMFK